MKNETVQVTDTNVKIHHDLRTEWSGSTRNRIGLVMMVRAQQQGISRIIVTPHSEAFHFFKEDASSSWCQIWLELAI